MIVVVCFSMIMMRMAVPVSMSMAMIMSSMSMMMMSSSIHPKQIYRESAGTDDEKLSDVHHFGRVDAVKRRLISFCFDRRD